MLDLNPRMRGRVFRIELSGVLDSQTAGDFTRFTDDILDQGYLYLILDSADLEYLSSAGISALIQLQKKLQDNDGLAVFTQLNPEIQSLLKFIGLSRTLPQFDNRDEALQYLRDRFDYVPATSQSTFNPPEPTESKTRSVLNEESPPETDRSDRNTDEYSETTGVTGSKKTSSPTREATSASSNLEEDADASAPELIRDSLTEAEVEAPIQQTHKKDQEEGKPDQIEEPVAAGQSASASKRQITEASQTEDEGLVTEEVPPGDQLDSGILEARLVRTPAEDESETNPKERISDPALQKKSRSDRPLMVEVYNQEAEKFERDAPLAASPGNKKQSATDEPEQGTGQAREEEKSGTPEAEQSQATEDGLKTENQEITTTGGFLEDESEAPRELGGEPWKDYSELDLPREDQEKILERPGTLRGEKVIPPTPENEDLAQSQNKVLPRKEEPAPGTEASRPEVRDAVFFQAFYITCENCQTMLRVNRAGNHYCPDCKARFRVSRNKSFYFY